MRQSKFTKTQIVLILKQPGSTLGNELCAGSGHLASRRQLILMLSMKGLLLLKSESSLDFGCHVVTAVPLGLMTIEAHFLRGITLIHEGYLDMASLQESLNGFTVAILVHKGIRHKDMGNSIGSKQQAGCIKIFDRFYSRELMSSLYQVLKHSYLPPSVFFVPCAYLKLRKARSKMEEYLPSPLASFLEMHLTKLLALVPPRMRLAGKGFEVWTGVTVNKSRSYRYLHVDNDEWLRTTKGKLISPLSGSILYVGPKKGMSGGSTIFLASQKSPNELPIFTHHSEQALRQFKGAIEVTPIPGRFVLFPGEVPHAVLTATLAENESPRITVLANLWGKRITSVPNGICSMTSIEYRGGSSNNKLV